MIIDGKKLAETVHEFTRIKHEDLKSNGLHPKIAIVTVGPEASWEAYVGQKIKFAEKLGLEKVLVNLKKEDEATLHETVKNLNNDPTVTGIIVQRPLPKSFDQDVVTNLVSPEKDIDGFRKDSKHEVPVWLAVKRILEEAYTMSSRSDLDTRSDLASKPHPKDFQTWLKEKNVVVIGKGESAGKLIIKGLYSLDILPKVIDSKTKKPDLIQKEADIIICCAGRQVVEAENLKEGVVLIGVGITRGEDNILYGDYDENEIKDIASFYTPTPGGVGPLNLAFLFSNLINAHVL